MRKIITITLNNAIEIDDKNTNKIELSEPMAGELRGLSLLEVVQLDANSITTLAPRISKLTEKDMGNMGAADLLVVGSSIAGFFAPAA